MRTRIFFYQKTGLLFRESEKLFAQTLPPPEFVEDKEAEIAIFRGFAFNIAYSSDTNDLTLVI